MNTAIESSAETKTTNYALASLRSGQEAYSKAYYEFRHLSESDRFAKLRLTYALLEKELFERTIQNETSTQSHHDLKAGPFSQDPRSAIFDIEESLAYDYLKQSDSKLLAWFEAKADELKIPRETMIEWRRQNAELSSNLDELTTAESRSSYISKEDKYELCG